MELLYRLSKAGAYRLLILSAYGHALQCSFSILGSHVANHEISGLKD